MRILWPHNFNPSSPNSGVFMYLLANGIRNLGVDVQLEYLGDLRSFTSLFKARKRLKQLAEDFDVVHAQFGSACAFATAGVRSTPKLVTLRGSDWNLYSGSLGFYYWHTRLARMLTVMSLKNFDSIIVVSDRMQKEVKHIFPHKIVHKIVDGIDLEAFKPKDKAKIRSHYGYNDMNEKWILYTSTSLTKPIKGFKLASDIIAIVKKKAANVRFRVANDLAHADIPEFVASCDLILCTSTAEGWPNAVKEALACNIPFVSTDVSDLSLIANQESSCKICPPDPQIFADAILDTLSHPPDYNLRQYVEDMDIEQTSRKLLDLYKKILD